MARTRTRSRDLAMSRPSGIAVEAAGEQRIRELRHGDRDRHVAAVRTEPAGVRADRVDLILLAMILAQEAAQIALSMPGEKEPEAALSEEEIDARVLRAGIVERPEPRDRAGARVPERVGLGRVVGVGLRIEGAV